MAKHGLTQKQKYFMSFIDKIGYDDEKIQFCSDL